MLPPHVFRALSALSTLSRPFRRSLLAPVPLRAARKPRIQPFSHSVSALSKPLPPLPKIVDEEITETFLKGSGPGGQKINKTSSAVQLQHHPTGIVVKCQATRSRSQNRKMARRLLAERLEELQLGDQARTRKKAAEASKKKKSKEKKSRRKYRALAAEKGGQESEEVQEEGAEAEAEPAEEGVDPEEVKEGIKAEQETIAQEAKHGGDHKR